MIETTLSKQCKSLFEKVERHYLIHDKEYDTAHDWPHVLRVITSCVQLGLQEHAQLELLIPAALLHDIVSLPKNHPQCALSSELAAKKAHEFLSDLYTPSQIALIQKIIVEHSFSKGLKPSSVESRILQDADRLDSLGAIGLMRLVACGVSFGSKFYHSEELQPRNRRPNDKEFMVDHLFTKILKLPDMMNTDAAKKEAKRRETFIRQFLDQLQNEMEFSNRKPPSSLGKDYGTASYTNS